MTTKEGPTRGEHSVAAGDAGVDAAMLDRDENGVEVAKRHGYRSVTDLLQHELGRRSHEVASLLRLGEVLRDGTYPTLAVAVEDGRVSLQQAHVIVDVLDDETKRFELTRSNTSRPQRRSLLSVTRARCR